MSNHVDLTFPILGEAKLPITNTKKGVITGGFDRTALFENVEKGFDKLFGYNRRLSETFEYCNTMKNGSMTDKLRIQEQRLKAPEQNSAGEKKKEKEDLQIDRYADKQEDLMESKFANKHENKIEDNQSCNQENKQDPIRPI